MPRFSQLTFQCLTLAKWYTGRRVSYGDYQKYLEADGYAWSSKAGKFLEEFGGLSIKFKRSEGWDSVNLNPCLAVDSFDSRWVLDSYASRIDGGKTYCVIGQAYSDHLLLFMANDGQVYGGFDNFLCFVGASGDEALETLCFDKKLLALP